MDIYQVIAAALAAASSDPPPDGDFFGDGMRPRPAAVRPATEAKIRLMQSRYLHGEQLFHPQDARWGDSEGPAWRKAGNSVFVHGDVARAPARAPQPRSRAA